MRRFLVIVTVVSTIALACAACGRSQGPALGTGEAVVTRVVDGDTIVVHVGGRDERRASHRHRHARDGRPDASRCSASARRPPRTRTSCCRRARPFASNATSRPRDATTGCSPTSTGSPTACSSTSRWPRDGYAHAAHDRPQHRPRRSSFGPRSPPPRRAGRGLWSACAAIQLSSR